jgi:16S rRNA (guanine(1405)-N(7))-methyltransferase
MTPEASVELMVEELKKTKKYRFMCDEALVRFAARASERHKRPADALKAAKRKLHQAVGAYLDDASVAKVTEALAHLPESAEGETLKSACRLVLKAHASTAERLPFLPDFYQTIFAKTGRPHTIVDLACGLNPFSWPWMGLPPDCRYLAADVDTRLMTLIDRLFARAGVHGEAACVDILSRPVPDGADMVLLMKTLPILDRQEDGAGEALLARLKAKWAVVTFPTKSLGGREKGMREHYAAVWGPLFRRMGYRSEALEFPTELVFILKKE